MLLCPGAGGPRLHPGVHLLCSGAGHHVRPPLPAHLQVDQHTYHTYHQYILSMSRTVMVAAGTTTFSLACILMGLSSQYWHLVILRYEIYSLFTHYILTIYLLSTIYLHTI